MLLALLAVRIFKGTLVVRATMTGLAFAVLGVAQLLYTNSYMPRAVRLPHLIEIGVSNALFGALAAVLDSIGSSHPLTSKRRPSAK